MNKIITRIAVIMFAFCLPFLFCACSFDSKLSYVQQRKNYEVPVYNEITDGEQGPQEPKQEGYNPEFFVEDGKYSWFAGYWEQYDGIRLASNPESVNVGENVDAQTKAERQNYFNDLYSQFEIMFDYIQSHFLCAFNEKVGTEEIITLTSGNYSKKFKTFSPEVLSSFKYVSETEEEAKEYNKKLGNSGEKIMTAEVVGWNYVEDALNPGSFIFEIKRNETNTKKGFLVDFSSSEHALNNKNFVMLRLMEIALNASTKTTYGFASTPEDAEKRMQNYMSSFSGLGLTFGDVLENKSFAFKLKKFLIEEVVGSDAINYYSSPKSFHEPFVDANENGTYDSGEVFFDVNKNGTYDETFHTTNDAFYFDFEQSVLTLVHNLSFIVDGEEEIDQNGNGVIDEKFPTLLSVEAQDISSENFFHPGTPADGNEKRKLTNMNYAEYKSAMFMPHITNPLDFSQRVVFNTLEIYVDSETDFLLDFYLKVYLNDKNYFVCHISTFNLNHTKDCDWGNEESTQTYENEFEEFFDGTQGHNAFSMIFLEDLFNYVTKNRPDDYILKCQNQGSLSDAEAMIKMLSPPNGAGALNEQMTYEDRGYHTSLTDNAELAEKYSYQNIDKNGTQALCYAGEESHVEFIFNVPNRQADSEYNFKFLIKTPDLTIEEEEE